MIQVQTFCWFCKTTSLTPTVPCFQRLKRNWTTQHNVKHKHAVLALGRVTDVAFGEYPILANCCFCGLLCVVIHLHCVASSDQFYSISLNLDRGYSSEHFTVHPAPSISSPIISTHNLYSPSGTSCHNTASIMFDRCCG